MKPAFEQLLPPPGQSFRCFNRETLAIAPRWHCHPEIELTYVERGSGIRVVGDNITNYHDQDLVLLGANLPHTWQSGEFQGQKIDQHPAVVIQFRQEFLGDCFFSVPEFHAVRAMLDKSTRGLRFSTEVATRIGRRLNQLLNAPPAVRLVQLLDCLRELAEGEEPVPLASVGFSSSLSPQTDSRVQRICSFIAENYRDADLTHQVLADHAGMNASAFSRFFRESTGKTAMNYIAEMRVSLACRLLVETDMAITDIYRQAGFANTSNFNRQFHRFREMSAREYRKLHRSVAGEKTESHEGSEVEVSAANV